MSTAEALAREATQEPPTDAPTASPSKGLLESFGDIAVVLGDWSSFSWRAFTGIFTKHLKARDLITHCLQFGLSSVGVVGITGTFIGMVLAVQAYSQFHQLGLETSLGAVIHMSVFRELGPVLAAVMLAGRIGCAMAAEIGTMRVTEQIDALACLGVDPIRYLVAPRFLASVLMIPLLTIFADLMGLVGSSFVCLGVYQIDAHHYWRHTQGFIAPYDIISGLMKSVVFGAVLALIACHRGFNCRPGAEGVGRAATEAFVASFVAILILDFFMALMANTAISTLWPKTTSPMA